MMPILAPPPVEPAAAPLTGLPRLRLPRLCVAVQGATPAEMMACAEGVLKDARFLEFRLDLLTKPAAGIPALKDFLRRHRDVQAIATCRRGNPMAATLPAHWPLNSKSCKKPPKSVARL